MKLSSKQNTGLVCVILFFQLNTASKDALYQKNSRWSCFACVFLSCVCAAVSMHQGQKREINEKKRYEEIDCAGTPAIIFATIKFMRAAFRWSREQQHHYQTKSINLPRLFVRFSLSLSITSPPTERKKYSDTRLATIFLFFCGHCIISRHGCFLLLFFLLSFTSVSICVMR